MIRRRRTASSRPAKAKPPAEPVEVPAAAPPPPPAAPPASSPAVGEVLLKAYSRQLAKKVNGGHSLTPAEMRMLQTIAAEEGGTAWPDRPTAARELSDDFGQVIHQRTLYEWTRLGAPIPRAGTIPKLPLYRWLAIEKRDKGRPLDDSGASGSKRDQLISKQVEFLTLKVDAMAGLKIDVQDANMIVDTAVEDLKTALCIDLPAKAAVAARKATTPDAAAETVRELVLAALASFAAVADQFAEKGKSRA